ncbi:MAG: class I poly(R)-hydroxyalkanoic acid synthase [Candidatus Eremiobacteraeota bacterium]|nr:class I poly(R)-hydroxyalkanoic acid synthase [Candidatus Eremiobacteraeota bacterium]
MKNNTDLTQLMDPLGIGKTSTQMWQAMLADPEHLVASQQKLANAWVDLVKATAGRAAGNVVPDTVTPQKGDKRFAHPAWDANPALSAMKQAYLIATQAILSTIEQTPGADPKTMRRAKFFAKQFADAMSPTNFAFFNPLVIEETLRTGGANLAKGMQHLIDDMTENEGRVSLVDKKAFKVGKNVGVSAGRVVYRNDLVELIQYSPSTPTVYEKPVVIFPPWINKFYILDLQPANSFVKHLVDAGYTTFIVSWRNPDASMRDTGMEDYLKAGPLECSRVAAEICGTPDTNVVAYCIGGTLMSMALAYLAQKKDKRINAATFLASLIDFQDVGEIDAFLGEDALAYIEKKMGERGYLDASQMGDSFNMLRANDLIWSVAVNRYLLGKDAPAFDLLYWNSDSTRMPQAMHSYYLRNMYVENNLVKPDALEIGGVKLDLSKIRNDTYFVATLEDHIAPWKTVYRGMQSFGGTSRFRMGYSGHIAGIVNPPGNPKGSWYEGELAPSAQAWFDAAKKHDGSWWSDWYAWLTERSGEQVPKRAQGSEAYPPQEEAPGTYVLEK